MQSERYLSNAVLIYLFLLIAFVVSNMLKGMCILDIIYLVALISSVIKYVMIIKSGK